MTCGLPDLHDGGYGYSRHDLKLGLVLRELLACHGQVILQLTPSGTKQLTQGHTGIFKF